MSYTVHTVKPGSANAAQHAGALLKRLLQQGETSVSRPGPEGEFLTDHLLVEKDGQPAGFASFFLNPGQRYSNGSTSSFGSLLCINDQAVMDRIISGAAALAAKASASWLLGPLNGSTWDEYRVAVPDKNPPYFLEPRHPHYYHGLIAGSGLKPVASYCSQRDAQMAGIKITGTVEKRLSEKGLSFRPISLSRFQEELKKMFHFCSSAFRRNFLFSPASETGFIERYLRLKDLIAPDYVIFAVDPHDELKGFIFAVPDIMNKTEKGLVVKTVARDPDFAYAGLSAVLGNLLTARARAHGYRYMIHALMHDENVSRNVSLHFSGAMYRKYVLFGKKTHE